MVVQGKRQQQKKTEPQVEWPRLIILEIRRRRQEDHCKFKAPLIYVESLKIKANGYIVRFSLKNS